MKLNETVFYWQKAIIVVAMVAAVVLLSIFGKELNAAVLPALLGGLSLALGMLTPPVDNKSTATSPEIGTRIPTIPAPPMPPTSIEIPITEERP